MAEQPWILSVKHFVFSGGAQKGIAFLGALQILEEIWNFCGKSLFIEIEGYAGSSIGALIALACAMQMPVKYMQDWFINQDTLGLVRNLDLTRLYSHCGLLPTDIIRTRVLNLMKFRFSKPEEITFLEFYKHTQKILKIVTTNVSKGVVQIFDHHHTPNAIVADAITMSMAVPFLFEPVEYVIHENTNEKNFYIDGGMYNNYPITLFPSNNVLGFRLRSRNLLSSKLTMKEYATGIMLNTMDYYEDKIFTHLSPEYQERTLTINLPPCNFWEMIETEKSVRESYVQQGEQSMTNFLFRGFFMGRMLLWLFSEMQSTRVPHDVSVEQEEPEESFLVCSKESTVELPLQNTKSEEHKPHTLNFEHS